MVYDLVKAGFNKVKTPWALIHPKYDVIVDLLPFGEIEENNKVGFNQRYTDLHVLGFKEVMKNSREYKIKDEIARKNILAPYESSLIPLPHQFLVLEKVMKSSQNPYLLADDVGMGKRFAVNYEAEIKPKEFTYD